MLSCIESKLKDIRALSDDPDTQTACIITNGSDRILIAAANAFAQGVRVTSARQARPAKYSFIVHAEINAIAAAAANGRSLRGSAMYLDWFPCAGCAGAIVQAGIAKLVANRQAYESRKADPRYSFGVALEILNEAGVLIEWL